MLRTPRRSCLILILFVMVGFRAFGMLQASGQNKEEQYDLHIAHRINAHGDEFMSLALTPDAKRLVVGSEGGELIVWGIAERRVLYRFHQGSPIHCVVALTNGSIIAAGGPHSGNERRGVVRQWRLDSGMSEEWKGAGESTIIALAADSRTGLVAAGNSMGGVVVWNSINMKPIAIHDFKESIISLALIKTTLYATSLSVNAIRNMDDSEESIPTNFILTLAIDPSNRNVGKLTSQPPGRLWGALKASPDGKFITAEYAEAAGKRVCLLDAVTGKEISSFPEHSAAWSEEGSLLLFNEEVPAALVKINSDGEISRSELLKDARFHAAGSPSNISGEVVSPDGLIVWEVFQQGASLVECDLKAKSCNQLYSVRGFAYAISVLESSDPVGLLASCGDDGFVRVWRLSDLTLLKAFPVPLGVPQGVALVTDGRHVVFSSSTKDSPTEILRGDIVSGEVKSLLRVPEPFVRVMAAADGFVYYKNSRLVLASAVTGEALREFAIAGKPTQFSLSLNGEWLAAAGADGLIYLFEVKTGKRVGVSPQKIDKLSHLVVANDGRFVYTTEWKGVLKSWNTHDNSIKELSEIRGQVASLAVSSDGKLVAVGGNHRDVGIYDAREGTQLTYLETPASDFYVTNVWVLGRRLLFTTDAGVLIDGTLER